ncbi:MAG: hypothetical protein JW725_04260 [Candidatus Babeliaceae bacterium]|nr:hypothetical protein [Candidatus Babeliaceae bacterium]
MFSRLIRSFLLLMQILFFLGSPLAAPSIDYLYPFLVTKLKNNEWDVVFSSIRKLPPETRYRFLCIYPEFLTHPKVDDEIKGGHFCADLLKKFPATQLHFLFTRYQEKMSESIWETIIQQSQYYLYLGYRAAIKICCPPIEERAAHLPLEQYEQELMHPVIFCTCKNLYIDTKSLLKLSYKIYENRRYKLEKHRLVSTIQDKKYYKLFRKSYQAEQLAMKLQEEWLEYQKFH